MAARIIFFIALLLSALIFLSGCLQSYRAPQPELCEKVAQQQNRDFCYSNAAFATGNSSLCKKIADLNTKDNCYTNLATGSNAPLYD